jgi:flagellar basal body P-ring formation protein FlgA
MKTGAFMTHASFLKSTAIGLVLTFSSAVFPALAAPLQPRATTKTQVAVALPAPVLRPDITVQTEIVTFGDLVANLPEAQRSLPAFRAPALGETGTIQVQRILDTAQINAIPEFERGAFAQVVVTRAARRVTLTEVEIAVRYALEERHGIDGRALAVQFEGGVPALAVEPELNGSVVAQDLVYDPRLRRVSATITVPGSAAMRLKPMRLNGQLVETIDVVVPLRAIAKGDAIASSDLTTEKRPRDNVGSDTASDLTMAIGKVAKRTISAGQPLRLSDVFRQEVVSKGDLVTISFEARGLVLSMRGKANEAGTAGDVITVMNLQSKRPIQGTITGPGRVTVTPGPVAGARVAVAE